ncbi:hypothetical protein ACVWZW_005026 [Bradyrhizobium sp. F1.13.4]
MLALASTLLTIGALADEFGRKCIFRGGITLFVVAFGLRWLLSTRNTGRWKCERYSKEKSQERRSSRAALQTPPRARLVRRDSSIAPAPARLPQSPE